MKVISHSFLNYPNLENSGGEVVLTNEHFVLQRLVVGAGEWEGVSNYKELQTITILIFTSFNH